MQALYNTFLIQMALAGVISGVSFYNFQERDTLIRRLGVLFLMSFVTSVLQFLSFKFGTSGALVNFIPTAYDFASIVVIVRIYNHITDRRYVRVFNFIAFLVIVWNAVNVIFFQNVGGATSLSKVAIMLMLLLFSIVFFYKLMRDLPTVYLHRLPAFWINSAFLCYAASSLFVFATHEYLIRALHDQVGLYWAFHNGAFIFQQLLILTGLYYDLVAYRSGPKHRVS